MKNPLITLNAIAIICVLIAIITNIRQILVIPFLFPFYYMIMFIKTKEDIYLILIGIYLAAAYFI